ncbi:MAG TPA: helix-turn-helix transcriptional regulator [Clostridia bacterium]
MLGISNNHKSINIDYYKGLEGRRAAFFRFLKNIQNSCSPVKLYLTSQSDLSWLIGDSAFINASRDLFSTILERITKVEVLHSFDRSISSLHFIMNKWIPLYLSGKIQGFDLNEYKNDRPKITIFITENTECLFSLDSENLDDCITLFITDKDIVSSYEKSFNMMKKNSAEVIKFISASLYKFNYEIINKEDSSGNYHAFLHTMPSLFMPAQLYESVLKTLNITNAEQNKLLKLYKSRFQELIDSAAKRKFSIIISVDFVEEIKNFGGVRYNGLDFFEDHDILVDPKVCLKHLQFLYDISKKHNLDIRFIKTQGCTTVIPEYNYIVKGNSHSMVFKPSVNKSIEGFLISDNAIILKTFYLLHETILESLHGEFNDFSAIFPLLEDGGKSAACSSLSGFYLTSREKEIAKLLLQGMSASEISKKLQISLNTVKCHISSIYKKVGVKSRYELIATINTER